MIPPPPPSLLDRNPQFAALHQHLIKEILNPDGSTASSFPISVAAAGATSKRDGATSNALKTRATERKELSRKLDEARIQHAKRGLLLQTIRQAASTGDRVEDLRNDTSHPNQGLRRARLPKEVKDLLVTVSILLSQLSGETLQGKAISPEDLGLLEEIISSFQSNIETISLTIGHHLQHQHTLLLNLLEPTATPPSSKPSTRHQQPPLLSTLLTTHLTTLTSLHQSLACSLLTTILPLTLPPNLSLQSHHLTLLIRDLDLHLHGTLTRHLRSRVSHLSTVSEGMSLKSRVLISRTESLIYDSEVEKAMRKYAKRLEEVEDELRGRREDIEEVLGEYREDGRVREIGRRYKVLLEEEGRLKEEIKRLDSREGGGGRVGRLR